MPKDLSNVVVWSGKGLKLVDIRVLCCDSVVVTLAQLTHHRSAVIKGEWRPLLDDLRTKYGVCGQFMVSSTAFACRRHVG